MNRANRCYLSFSNRGMAFRGAHAARVWAMTSPSSRTFSSSLGSIALLCRKIVSAKTPKPAREPRALPRFRINARLNPPDTPHRS